MITSEPSSTPDDQQLTMPVGNWPLQTVQIGDRGDRDDAWALSNWLGFLASRNTQTLRSYRTEVLRFRIFLECQHAGSPERAAAYLLRDATERDVSDYEAQLLGRNLSGRGQVAPLVVPAAILARYGRTDQPFVSDGKGEEDGAFLTHKARKRSSVNQALSILHALYQHWLKPDPATKTAYVGANPVSRVKSSTNRAVSQTERAFPLQAIEAMLSSIEADLQHVRAAANAKGVLELERRRWTVALLFGLWARRAEIARLTMADFTFSQATKRWSVLLIRKGGKEDRLPLADWVMDALVRYRTSLGLSPLPTASEKEKVPAIGRLRTRTQWENKPVSPEVLYRDVARTGARAAQCLRRGEICAALEPLERETLAVTLEALSPHWFRHSGASIAINTGAMSLENASKMLGHADPAMTAAMYYHRSDAQLSEGVQKMGAGLFR